MFVFQLHEFFFDYTLRTVAAGAATLGLMSGALGSFAVLRRQSLLGDAVAHAALPGIALAFLITGSRETWALTIGAAILGWVGALLVIAIRRTTRIKEDTALGLVLSVFFGFGLLLLTFIQKRPNSSQAGLDKFLFGQAATLLISDVWLIVALGAAAIKLKQTTIIGPVGSPAAVLLAIAPPIPAVAPNAAASATITPRRFVHWRAAAAGATTIALIKITPTVCSPATIAITSVVVKAISKRRIGNPSVAP
jgi:ABC-type Mn2+/Zn2+ transport system permease subunit